MKEELIERARAFATELGLSFVPAITKEIVSEDMVKVNIPCLSSKYLKKIPAHKLLVFKDEQLEEVMPLEIAEHYVHGDFPAKQPDGKIKPVVFRHFYVLPGYFGETIAARVSVKEKTNLLTGEVSLIIDISQIFGEGDVFATKTLRLGVNPINVPGEVLIPGMNKVIRLDKINPVLISRENSSAELLSTKK